MFTVVRAISSFSKLTTTENIGDCVSATTVDRLPLDIMKLKNYDIKFIISPNYDSIIGTCVIFIHIHYRTESIRLQAYKIQMVLNQIQLVTIDESPEYVKTYIPVGYRYCKISQMLDLHFEDDIWPGLYHLKLNFLVSLKHNEYKGLYQYESIEGAKTQRWLFTNVFEPFAARRLFPCWDESGIKATFNLSVMHPMRHMIISNMLKRIESAAIDTFNWTHFMPSSLITASEVKIIMIDKDMTHFSEIVTDTMWYYKESERKLNFAHFTAVLQRMSLIQYANVFQIPKMEHIVIPNSPMQTAGSNNLVIYRERDIAYDETSDFIGVELNIEKIIASQMARHLFRQIIPLSSWSNKWMIESFGTYFSYFFSNESYYRQQLEELFVVQILQPALYYDNVLQMKPVAREIINADDIDTVLFSRFYRYKGSVFLRMWKHIASKKFEKRIKKYVTESARQADGEDFWEIMQGRDTVEEQSHPSIQDIIHGWAQVKRYPELYVTYDGKTVNTKASCENDTKLYIPMSFLAPSKAHCIRNVVKINWRQCNGAKITSKQEWPFIIGNVHQVGYYRINYDNKNWRRVGSYLQYSNHTCIPVQNRAQLIDDAYYFAITGNLHKTYFFHIIEYLQRETHYVPWYPMFNILSYMSAYLKTSASKRIKLRISGILGGLLNNIGYEEHPEDDGMTKSLRLLAAKWFCELGHSECRIAASNKLYTKLSSPTIEILPWWNEWVYCTGMMHLNKTIWQQILVESIQSSDVSKFKYLACTDRSDLLINYMDFLRTNNQTNNLMEYEQLVKHYRFTLTRNLAKESVFDYALVYFKDIVNRFYQNDTLILWGDIIWSIYDKQQRKLVVEKSENINRKNSRKQKEIQKIIKARWNHLSKLRKKFSEF
ncbi:PREDICTED: thyrotropin-releasing hormone-degrading ectoenzyme-like [Dinoponera quadriceps]|uniref:Thyrotropin-releasing hormone-degrading ectoenzyme-like n=1 Tax=Dinoponera quadriceps TaxID=609295 RepID=A0A6P3YAL5_DINQU|nr:PREDICTED: thyrotropin-releasing hormone-degrading ectoenzyme-like [Dinoponera quadriceps]